MILSLCMEIQETDEQQPDEQGVAIYSKLAVLLFSIFFSPLIGGILLMLNLRSVGYKKQGTTVLLFAIVFQLISGLLVRSTIKTLPAHATGPEILTNTKFILYTLVSNIIGGGILAEYFFKKYFPDDDYEHKSVWRPLLIILLISISFNLLFRI